MARADQFVLAYPAVAAKTLADLVTLEKSKPGSLAYGTWGEGSPPHLVYETLNKMAGTRFLHVPYKGVAPVLNALVADEVQLTVGSSGVAGELLKSGKLKALAIAAKERSPLFPEVPTTTEAGYPQVQASIWFGLAAPAGTPREIVDKLCSDARDALSDPAFTGRFITRPGWKRVASTPADMDARSRTNCRSPAP